MDTYFDTSALVKLYVSEEYTDVVAAYITRRGKPIAVHGLHELEMENALHLKVFRNEMSERQCHDILARIRQDRERGFCVQFPVDWPEAFQGARRISALGTARCGCRSLDLLHIAVALQWGCSVFVSMDDRQIGAASIAKFKILDVRTLKLHG